MDGVQILTHELIEPCMNALMNELMNKLNLNYECHRQDV